MTLLCYQRKSDTNNTVANVMSEREKRITIFIILQVVDKSSRWSTSYENYIAFFQIRIKPNLHRAVRHNKAFTI
jgi:hypothetical protein